MGERKKKRKGVVRGLLGVASRFTCSKGGEGGKVIGEGNLLADFLPYGKDGGKERGGEENQTCGLTIPC